MISLKAKGSIVCKTGAEFAVTGPSYKTNSPFGDGFFRDFSKILFSFQNSSIFSSLRVISDFVFFSSSIFLYKQKTRLYTENSVQGRVSLLGSGQHVVPPCLLLITAITGIPVGV